MSNYSGDIELTFKTFGTVVPDVYDFFVQNTLSALLDWPGLAADSVCRPESSVFGRVCIYYTASSLPDVPTFKRLMSINDLQEFNIWYSDSDMTDRGEFRWNFTSGSKESEVVVWTHLQEAVKRQKLMTLTFKSFNEYELEELYQKYRDVDRIDVPVRNPNDPSFQSIMEALQHHRRHV